MMQTSAQRARSHSARAAAYTRRAEADARRSADAYATALGWQRQAEQLTQASRFWYQDYTPAALESAARTWARVGGTFLRASFHNTEMAAQYREMAALARELAS